MLDKVKVKSLIAELKAQMTTNIESDIVEEFKQKIEKEAEIVGEVWRDIIGYEGMYQASNLGRIRSCKSKFTQIMKTGLEPDGYLTVPLRNHGVKYPAVHRLVAMAFIPNPENKRTVNHIDGDKTNNRLNNLEWATHKENLAHAIKIGKKKHRYTIINRIIKGVSYTDVK